MNMPMPMVTMYKFSHGIDQRRNFLIYTLLLKPCTCKYMYSLTIFLSGKEKEPEDIMIIFLQWFKFDIRPWC